MVMEDLEFASKEDLEAIKADPKLAKVYQSMQAGVTKKFQAWSDDNKKLQDSVKTLTQQVTELDSGLMEWENWFTQNKDVLTNLGKSNQNDQDDKKVKVKTDKELDDRYEKLVETFRGAANQFESRLNHLGRMLNLSMQLNDIVRLHPEVDGMKVLDSALKGGYQDLTLAYKEAYSEDILNKQVEEKLKPRLEEERLKRETNVETGSGATPMTFELPKEIPKTFTEAGHQFLEDRAKEANKP
jgi:hypothetical protein